MSSSFKNKHENKYLKYNKNAEFFNNQALLEVKQGRFKLAVDNLKKALAIDPINVVYYINLGNVYTEIGDFESSIDCYLASLKIEPDNPDIYYNRGILFCRINDFNSAKMDFEKSISLNEKNHLAFNNLGNVFFEMKDFYKAIACYDKATIIQNDFAEGYQNLGKSLKEIGQYTEAIENLNKAINFNSKLYEAYNCRALIFMQLKNYPCALEDIKSALSLNKNMNYVWSNFLTLKLNLCDWTELGLLTFEISKKIKNSEKVGLPFVLSAVVEDIQLLKKSAEIYIADKFPLVKDNFSQVRQKRNELIKVAYLSCDFRNHPATLNNIQIWERFNRSLFELFAFSYGPIFQEDATAQGQMRSRLVNAFDQFLDVGDKSDEQIAQLMREMEIDIVVDLSGLTNGGRQGILAYRPAPVQVNFYSFTSGAPYIDYIISDRVTIPPEHQHGYTEKVVYLPDTCIGVDTSRQVSSRQFKRSELGLPESGVVYCSFNNVYKINPQMFDVWMRILQQVPGSVLWLQGGSHENVKENLRREAQARGVQPDRLVFAARMELMAEHLARHRAADVFLDTLPFNAHTTAADALWAGLPVLTCLGESSLGRIAGSFLMALDMPELVMQDIQAYEAMAVKLGTDKGLVQQLKNKLDQHRLSTPMFDMERLTKNIEATFAYLYQNYHAT